MEITTFPPPDVIQHCQRVKPIIDLVHKVISTDLSIADCLLPITSRIYMLLQRSVSGPSHWVRGCTQPTVGSPGVMSVHHRGISCFHSLLPGGTWRERTGKYL